MGGITLFPHVHVIDGVVICHSHPYSGTSDNPGHSHSSAQLDTIAHLSLALFVLMAIGGGFAFPGTASRIYSRPTAGRLCAATPVVMHLRGPPVR